jgi:hypothetical protein
MAPSLVEFVRMNVTSDPADHRSRDNLGDWIPVVDVQPLAAWDF